MDRRDALGIAAVAALATASRAGRADTGKLKPGAGLLSVDEWLARAALLLDETRRAQDYVGARPGDLGLASIAWELAEARSQIATRLVAPDKAKQAHMHLLLCLENTTAALDARVRGDEKRFAQRMTAARTEERTLEHALEVSKLKLPSVK